jgi:small ligand-binding sensory domain FIST
MGGNSWFYFVKYEKDINHALQQLKEREFRAGRYSPVILLPEFPVDENSQAPGAGHQSIEEAIDASGESGTGSILDMVRVGKKREFRVITPIAAEQLELLYGTKEPSREQVVGNMEFFEEIDRGEGIYIITYRDGAASEILFAGYSVD